MVEWVNWIDMGRGQRLAVLCKALMIERAIIEECPMRLEGTVAAEDKAKSNPHGESTGVDGCDGAKVSAIASKELTRSDQDVDESTCACTDQAIAYIQGLRTKGWLVVYGRIMLLGIEKRRVGKQFQERAKNRPRRNKEGRTQQSC